MKARITVCVPSFQYARFLRECLDSILGQTGADFVVLAADNASTDDSAAILTQYAEQDNRLTAILRSEDLGYSGGVNDLLARVQTDYVTVLAADDQYLQPDFLAQAIDALDVNPELAFFHTAYVETNATGEPLREIRYMDHACTQSGLEAQRSLLRFRLPWISAVVTRRSLVETAGGLPEEFAYACDLGWMFRLARHGSVHYSPQPAVSYRQHSASLSGSISETVKTEHRRRALDMLKHELRGDEELTAAWNASRDLLDAPALTGSIASARKRLHAELAQRPGQRIAIYGAGMHTRQVLNIDDIPSILAFADRDPAYRGETLHDQPILSPDLLRDQHLDAVIVSSRAHQEEIVTWLELELGDVDIVRLYDAPE